MARSVGPWQYLDDLGISVCLATALIAVYSTWIAKYFVDFISIVFSVPIYLFWGFAIGGATVSTPWALLSVAGTVVVLLLIFLALRLIDSRLARIAVVTALLCAQVTVVTMIGRSIHFLEQA